jgi:hypothetical protein
MIHLTGASQMEPQLPRHEPTYTYEIQPDFSQREHELSFAGEAEEAWTDAREGRDELGRY